MMNEKKAYSVTCKELAKQSMGKIPDALVPSSHLIYSSPSTLSYNSPGAFGFGVKRAALVMPESVMLLISPGCCGRNSTILGSREDYAERMYYLNMDETDLVSGRHLSVIPAAVREIVETAEPVPKAVILCITCVDALLGTDLERICRRAEMDTGVHVVPSYMYALTREGIKPPMTAVRQTVYSLLVRDRVNARAVNLLGFFTPVQEDSDLFEVLHRIGVTTVKEISKTKTFEEYEKMGESNFNLVLFPESLYAAEDLKERLGMPYVELKRLYDLERIEKQYALFASALGVEAELKDLKAPAEEALSVFRTKTAGKSCAIGQMLNANPFELACSLTGYGMNVKAIIAIPTEEDLPYLKRLAAISPDTRVFMGVSPTMMNFGNEEKVDLTLGQDIGGYFPEAAHLDWNFERQPFGFRGLCDLLNGITEVLV